MPYMEFNLLILTRFEVTTTDSQEPSDNSHQCWPHDEVGVNSNLIRCILEVPNSTGMDPLLYALLKS